MNPKDNYPRVKKAEKAYDSKKFIHSQEGRTVRILAEYLHPERYFNKHKIRNAVVIFGSARTFSQEEFDDRMTKFKNELDRAQKDQKPKIKNEIEKLEHKREFVRVYEETVEISRRISEWSLNLKDKHRFYICTGGGPGMMEAANRGAFEAGAPNIGLNISLPFEQFPNQYITPKLNFEFHYFFMRKFWFANLAQAMVVMPGGFGTMDELFEILTLRQTGKSRKKMPVILYHSHFWKTLINFEYLAEIGVIDRGDLDLFTFADTPDEVCDYLFNELTRIHNLEFINEQED